MGVINEIGNIKDFENLLKYEKSIFFKFTAPWCKPCQMIQPILNSLSSNYLICSIDIDKYPDLADRYNVESIPTIIHFQNGLESKKCTGSSIQNIQNFFTNC